MIASFLIQPLIILGMVAIGAMAPGPKYHNQWAANPHHYGWVHPGHHFQGGQWGRPTCVAPGTRDKYGFAPLVWCDELAVKGKR